MGYSFNFHKGPLTFAGRPRPFFAGASDMFEYFSVIFKLNQSGKSVVITGEERTMKLKG